MILLKHNYVYMYYNFSALILYLDVILKQKYIFITVIFTLIFTGENVISSKTTNRHASNGVCLRSCWYDAHGNWNDAPISKCKMLKERKREEEKTFCLKTDSRKFFSHQIFIQTDCTLQTVYIIAHSGRFSQMSGVQEPDFQQNL